MFASQHHRESVSRLLCCIMFSLDQGKPDSLPLTDGKNRQRGSSAFLLISTLVNILIAGLDPAGGIDMSLQFLFLAVAARALNFSANCLSFFLGDESGRRYCIQQKLQFRKLKFSVTEKVTVGFPATVTMSIPIFDNKPRLFFRGFQLVGIPSFLRMVQDLKAAALAVSSRLTI